MARILLLLALVPLTVAMRKRVDSNVSMENDYGFDSVMDVDEVMEEDMEEVMEEDMEYDGKDGTEDKPRHDDDIVMSAEIFEQIKAMGERIEAAGTGYGPGRGLEDKGDLWVTRGLSKFDYTSWKSRTGKHPPSFHCSSLTNFFASWLFNFVDPYKGSGSMCSMFESIYNNGDIHACKSSKWGTYRGWGDHTFRVKTNGDTGKRWGGTGWRRKDGHRGGDMSILDPLELYNRKGDPDMPTIMFAAQSTKQKNGKFKYYHHVGLYFIDPTTRELYRWFADGWKGKKSKAYSLTPVRFERMTREKAARMTTPVYRIYGIDGLSKLTAHPDVKIESVDSRDGSAPRPLPRPRPSPTPSSDKCVIEEKGTCLDSNRDQCDGAFVRGMCRGAANIQCCIPFKEEKEKKCTNEGNNCWYTESKKKCDGKLTTGKCPGSSSIRCCE